MEVLVQTSVYFSDRARINLVEKDFESRYLMIKHFILGYFALLQIGSQIETISRHNHP